MFLVELLEKIRSAKIDRRIVIVLDNHAAHRSKLLRAFFEREDVVPLFTPPYSSPLNAIEHAWAVTKREWATQMARITKVYDKNKFETDLALVTERVFQGFTFTMMHGSDKSYRRVLAHELV